MQTTAWFIALWSAQHFVTFLALLVGIQGVIERLERNRAEGQKIETVTLFGVAQ